MHIPDGFTSDHVNAAMGAVAVVSLAYSVWGVRKRDEGRNVFAPLFAVVASFIFAAQMLNFPIGGGTSGHFLGAVLAASLLGPWGACLALAVVLGVQGVFFGDGGLSALGANIVNMGVIGGLAAYPVLRRLRAAMPEGRFGFYAAVGMTSWFSIVAASGVCALELAASGTSPLSVAVPAMVGTHALIGVGEAAISVAALVLLHRFFPSVMPSWAKMEDGAVVVSSRTEKGLVAAGLAFALALAMFASPFASSSPDGLEKVAEDHGFLAAASEDKVVWANSPFPDYQVAAVHSDSVSTGLAGLIGSLLVFGLAFGSGRGMASTKRS